VVRTNLSSIFSVYVGPADPSGLTSLAASLGVSPKFATDYFDDTSWAGIADDTWDLSAWQNSGYQMIWGVPMLPATGGYTLAAGATGAYDSYFTTLADNLVADGMGTAVLRLGWEFNTSSSPWQAAGQAANFVAYWRQIVTTMRAVPGQHFLFEWNVNRGDNGSEDAAIGNLASYYPGNSYVDIVGMDIYDLGWNTYPGAAAEFTAIETQKWGLNWLASFGAANDKPLAIPEFGLGWGTSAPGSGVVSGAPGATCGGDDPTFIRDMANWIAQNNVVNAAFFSNGASSVENGANPLTAAALRSEFGS
jgi:hypothetical protein